MGAEFRFLHCADLHIGSAFTGLSRRLPELDGKLARTPFLAWQNAVAAAIREKVDFVLISGDCFDRNAPSLKGRCEFNKGLETLNAARIPVLLVSGNHDPYPQSWSKAVKLPENVFFFPVDEVKLYPVVKNGEVVATVAGISHDSLHVFDNLAVQAGNALKEAPGVRIALVHANLCGDQHAAPATLADLTALPVDYWALGHVHSRRVLSEKPFVVYAGCTQGKDIHEPGAQGCFVVDCDGTGIKRMTFHQTSVLEFENIDLNISDVTDLEKTVHLLSAELATLKKENDLLFRLKLTGITSLDADLRRWNNEDLYTFFYDRVRELFPGCFLEGVFVLTQMPGKERSAVFPEEELTRSLQELTEEKFLENRYEEMCTVFRALPPLRADRFEELRRESCELLAELLTGRVELGRK